MSATDSSLRTWSEPRPWSRVFLVALAVSVATTARGQPPAPRALPEGPLDGAQLYTHYCAACHGETGDGNGPAAKFLNPKPRNFRDHSFRLVTTLNLVPSDEDLLRVIDRGMPGSAMFPFAHLPEVERKLLVAHVRQLFGQGMEAKLRQAAADFGEEPDPDELAAALTERTTPGELLTVPERPRADAASLERARIEYLKTCASCHGETGRGDGVQEQKDEAGLAIRPRDFTRGIFKGGGEPDQLYARIALGVPGTPMPASPALSPEQVGDMVNYVLAMAGQARPERVEHKRTRLIARKVNGALPEAIPGAAWANVVATPIVASPLWWRDADPGLTVQAIHDGRSLAIRLAWTDASANDQAVRVQDFPDMAALQLFQGPREPFLGMGAEGALVDLWLWNSAAQGDLAGYRDVDTVYPNMAVDHYLFERPGEGPRRHPTDRQPKDFLAAWAAGNQRSDPTHLLVGSALQAKGFGSLTLRPRPSQRVVAVGRRLEDGWEVVLRRPLKVEEREGLALAPGGRAAIAFALWDGAFFDRAGQKLVSIWHDLELE
jgi:mono/diheme cytochrome c family protein